VKKKRRTKRKSSKVFKRGWFELVSPSLFIIYPRVSISRMVAPPCLLVHISGFKKCLEDVFEPSRQLFVILKKVSVYVFNNHSYYQLLDIFVEKRIIDAC
jgi:hypothetical protein